MKEMEKCETLSNSLPNNQSSSNESVQDTFVRVRGEEGKGWNELEE